MKLLDIKQGSDEWLRARSGLVTASELDQLLTPALLPRTGDMPNSYVARKIAEKWTGYPMQSFGGGVMEQGSILEHEAMPWLEIELGCDIARPGLVLTDDGAFGASPDGTMGDVGIEIKCPQPPKHVAWLIAGKLPAEHMLQVQGGMYATGWKEWIFLSYCRDFPPLFVRVGRDEEAMAAIGEAVANANAKIAEGMAIMGGMGYKRPEVNEDSGNPIFM